MKSILLPDLAFNGYVPIALRADTRRSPDGAARAT